MPASGARTSSQSGLSAREDETLQLALMVLSLSSTSPANRTPLRPPSPSPPASQPDTSSPSSLSSWVDLPPYAATLDETLAENTDSPARRPAQRRKTPRMNSGVRQGLSNLPTPPSPFGSQLRPSKSSHPRSTPYHHIPRHNTRFTPRPKRRALAVENDQVPRPDPDDVYHTLLSAVESFKSLVKEWGKVAADVITQDGKKDLSMQVVKVGLGMVCLFRPSWVLGTMNASWTVLRNPWRSYHHALYTMFIARVLLS